MPRRSLDPAAKPFEVKVGLAFPAFGGMYFLGDPSMCPPNRARKLVNVRLGDKDIVSRPGLREAYDAGNGLVVNNMIEIFENEVSGLWFGPYAGTQDNLVLSGSAPSLRITNGVFVKIDLSTHPFDSGDGVGHYGWLYHYDLGNPRTITAPAFADLDALAIAYGAIYPRNGALCPCSHYPNLFTWDPDGLTDYSLISDAIFGAVFWPIDTGPEPSSGWPFNARGIAVAYPPGQYGDGKAVIASLSEGPIADYLFHCSDDSVQANNWGPRQQYLALSWAPDQKLLGGMAGEPQGGAMLDPPVFFSGKWLAAGNYRGDQWPPALLGGQQVFEVNLSDKASPITDPSQVGWPDAAFTDGWPAYEDFKKYVATHFFPGSIAQAFRMPGQCVASLPLRGSAGLDGKTIRSWAVRTVRNDNPIGSDQATAERLYIGTHGGAPWIAGGWGAFGESPDIAGSPTDAEVDRSCYIPPRNTFTDGEVYSWDGTTLRPEVTTGIGQNVVIGILPDGTVVAAGRTGCKYLDASDGIWKVATFPTPSPVPYVMRPTVPAFDHFAAPVGANADFVDIGFEWIDRIVYKGELYLSGFDVALLARGRRYVGMLSTLVNIGAAFHSPYVRDQDEYWPVAKAWVLYRFDRDTATLVKVVDGWDFLAPFSMNALGLTPDQYDAQVLEPPYGMGILATDHEHLYVSTIYAEDVGDVPRGLRQFNGSTWSFVPGSTILPGGQIIYDMVSASSGVYIMGQEMVFRLDLDGDMSVAAGTDAFNQGMRQHWTGGDYLAPFAGTYRFGRMFIGPK